MHYIQGDSIPHVMLYLRGDREPKIVLDVVGIFKKESKNCSAV